MTLPFHRTIKVFTGATASETLSYLYADPNFPVENFGQIKLTLEFDEFTGSIDFEWSTNNSVWRRVPHMRVDTDAALTAGVIDTLEQFSGETEGRMFVVPGGPFPYFRIVMVRTSGTITAGLLQGFEHDTGYMGSR